ncbi:MAG: hypothetical protein QJT81_06050 [Candidatus Thiothrix putei]|uniref:Uncharacterized protein n=1 Tax=Candidatus Thiothrix putei TaxID=3080811 RepID=A0AA95HGK6_9GAMM|nr:MAG: hypothetical protein QJT81_06050 [Candidatus Thiothrix putei]
MQYNISLEVFLEHVRLRGVYVGLSEVRKMQAIFSRMPHLSRIDLLSVLQSVLAKNEFQFDIIKNVFDQLIPYEMNASVSMYDNQIIIDASSTLGQEVKTHHMDLKQKKSKDKSLYILVFLTVVFFVIFSGWGMFENNIVQPVNNVSNFDTENNIDFILLVLSLICLVVLSLKIYKNINIEPAMLVKINHHGKSFIPPVTNGLKTYLLDATSRKKIEWEIECYINNDLSASLSMDETVRLSAIKGMPAICFNHPTHQKKLWLWQDQFSQNSNLFNLVDEISILLKNMNIHFDRGYFRGGLSFVNNQRGEVIWSLSARQQHFNDSDLILVFCDSDSLLWMRSGRDAAFQAISKMDNLAFVNCDSHGLDICKLIADDGVRCLLPNQIGDWIAGKIHYAKVNNLNIFDDLHRLAVACSLPERQVMEDEIRALHEILKLNCIWFYDELQRYAEKTSFGLDFEKSRMSLMQDFSKMALIDNNDFYKILDFWIKRNVDINVQLLKQETPHRPWSDSRRQKLLELDIALLEMWIDPEKAAKKIYALWCNSDLSEVVESRMQPYSCQVVSSIVPAKNEKPLGIELPFSWADLSIETQKQLVSSGFSGMSDDGFWSIDKASQIILGILFGIVIISIIHIFIRVFLIES